MAASPAPRNPIVTRSGRKEASATVPFMTTFINLRSREDRLQHMVQHLHCRGFTATRLEALTGDDAPLSDVADSWDSTLNSHFDEKTLPSRLKMSPGERGCAASHILLWRAFAQRPLDSPPLLVLEDDVLLREDALDWSVTLVEAVQRALSPQERHLLMYLGCHVSTWRDGTKADDAENRASVKPAADPVLVRGAAYLWYTSSYFLWPAAARTLVAALPVDAPVDCFLARLFLSKLLAVLEPTRRILATRLR
jgi:GR25 family glycosyltransferase involved in LPS biosynthesis